MPDITPQQKYNQMIAAGVPADQAQALAYGTGNAASTGPVTSGDVYWGTSPGRTGHVRDADLSAPNQFQHFPGERQTKTQDDAMYWLETQGYQGTADYQRILSELEAAGAVKTGATLGTVLDAWRKYLALSAMSTAQGGNLTPEDYIKLDARLNQGGGGGPTVTHSTSITTNQMSAADVDARTQNVAQSALGRRLTPKEAAAYRGSASAVQAANPSISSTTRTVNAAGTSARDVTSTSGGAGAGAIDEALLHQAMQNPEYGAYQAAGYYFPVLQQALGAVTGAGR